MNTRIKSGVLSVLALLTASVVSVGAYADTYEHKYSSSVKQEIKHEKSYFRSYFRRVDNHSSLKHEGYRRYFMKSMFTANLDGSQEVPGPGDPDGRGESVVKLDHQDGQVCVNLQVLKISPATAAHIHKALRGHAGPVVVTLPTPDDQGKAWRCMDADREIIKNIGDHPEEYYVNVHNNEYPDGAIRGQLGR